jgi:hypothetical protein
MANNAKHPVMTVNDENLEHIKFPLLQCILVQQQLFL